MELKSEWFLKKRQTGFRNKCHHWCIYMERAEPRLKKNGKPFNPPKPIKEVLFSVPTKEIGEYICLFHNTQLKGRENTIEDFINSKIEQQREELLEILGLANQKPD